MTKYLINEYYDVEDANASSAFAKGDKREDYADAWRNTGNVVLIGLAGSGKNALGLLLSEKTGLPLVVPGDAAQAKEALEGQKQVVVLADELVEDAAVQPLIHGSGKVFYLLADSNTLSMRVAKEVSEEEREQIWRDMSARLAMMEPVFYSVLHFILQAGQEPELLVDDAMEKVGF